MSLRFPAQRYNRGKARNRDETSGAGLRPRFTGAVLALVVAAALPLIDGTVAQQTGPGIDISAFDGYEDWPVVKPGDINATNAALRDQRIIFDAQFPGPQGLGGPLADTTMVFDVSEVCFKGTPALSVEWRSTGREGADSGTVSIDYLVVDRATHSTLHRIRALGGAMGPPEWASPIVVTNYPDGLVISTTVKEDGAADAVTLEAQDTGTIDFAALPFWLPFIDLKEGAKFRVPYYRQQLNTIDGLPIYVQGQKEVTDASGQKHKIWNVQVMSIGGGALTEFWVAETAPYFFGWDFRLVGNGKTVSTMTYNKHWVLDRQGSAASCS